jgi:HlyD family secretion protein
MKINSLIFILLITTLVSCKKHQNESDAYGNFEATEIVVSSQVNGKIEVLNINEGQVLKPSEKYGFIDTTDLYLKKMQLAAQKEAVKAKNSNIFSQLEVLKQQKKNLEVDLNRVTKMLKEGAATQKQYDDLSGNIEVIDKQVLAIQTQYQSIVNEVESIQKQVEQIESNIKKSYITVDYEGTVLVKYAEQGEFVTIGKPLFKMADLKKMILKVYVSGDQLSKIKIGAKCKVFVDKDNSENVEYTGVVAWVAENAEFTPKIIQTKKERVNLVYAVKIIVENDGTFKIGMPGEVMFN